MLSLDQIHSRSNDAARKAAQANETPWVVWPGDVSMWPPFPFPFIGEYVPRGWKKVEEYFVDSSGFGAEDEPALTIEQFKARVKEGRGYAITQAGEFQVYVGEYIRC